jgi:hypothetical protein
MTAKEIRHAIETCLDVVDNADGVIAARSIREERSTYLYASLRSLLRQIDREDGTQTTEAE